MKIYCDCGTVILDSSDNLSYKAYFISDRDYYNMTDSIFEEISKFIEKNEFGEQNKQKLYVAIGQVLSRNESSMYQCFQCGQLFLDNIFKHFQKYVPTDITTDKNILGSLKQRDLVFTIQAEWLGEKNQENRGTIHWRNGGLGYNSKVKHEYFCEYKDFEKRYEELFAQFCEEKILLISKLTVEKECLHYWKDGKEIINLKTPSSKFLN